MKLTGILRSHNMNLLSRVNPLRRSAEQNVDYVLLLKQFFHIEIRVLVPIWTCNPREEQSLIFSHSHSVFKRISN